MYVCTYEYTIVALMWSVHVIHCNPNRQYNVQCVMLCMYSVCCVCTVHVVCVQCMLCMYSACCVFIVHVVYVQCMLCMHIACYTRMYVLCM